MSQREGSDGYSSSGSSPASTPRYRSVFHNNASIFDGQEAADFGIGDGSFMPPAFGKEDSFDDDEDMSKAQAVLPEPVYRSMPIEQFRSHNNVSVLHAADERAAARCA